MANIGVVCFFGFLLVIGASFSTTPAAGQITYPQEAGALRAVRRSLYDPDKYLANWRKGDPCASNWTGVLCYFNSTDGYLHVKELRLMKKKLYGILAPEVGELSHLTILNFMWNNISGSIPKQIGDIKTLKYLLLSGNYISGSLPDELGYLPNLIMFQIDCNNISGPLPKTYANLTSVQHFHLNNNSISGQIPSEISALPSLLHLLLDNNKLSGPLPPELSNMPNLTILQLDNNNFGGNQIPESYTNMTTLLKLSLRNCGLRGVVPDFSRIPHLLYLDLSQNQLTGMIPTNKLSENITTIDLSSNEIGGTIPLNFSGFPNLQKLSLAKNSLVGTISSSIWQNINFTTNTGLVFHLDGYLLNSLNNGNHNLDYKLDILLGGDFHGNLLTNISDNFNPPSNVNISLGGNPVCEKANELKIVKFCRNSVRDHEAPGPSVNKVDNCPPHNCLLDNFAYVPNFTADCFCAAPIGVGFLLRSPSISDFPPYTSTFSQWIVSNLDIHTYQLHVNGIMWAEGPRLVMFLKLFPAYPSSLFNSSELERIVNYFATMSIKRNNIFGPYTLLNFTLLGPYEDAIPLSKSGISKGALAGIIIGGIFAAGLITFIAVFFLKMFPRWRGSVDKQRGKLPCKIEGLREFSFDELKTATNNFSIPNQVGQGAYGRIYKGTLANGTIVAVKRAHSGSVQGNVEFFTEIELLSRVHHRNLVSLLGYCAEGGEQILVYEFMPNGSLHDVLSARFKEPPSFAARLRIALGAAKGILYLHTEADPPIIHRDIKANNILLDANFRAKVSDFGISRLIPTADGTGLAPSHVFTAVKGTPGYVDPEYFQTHQLTEKSDVYSLGIVLLELLTGMQPIFHGKHIVQQVMETCERGRMFSIIDRGMGAYPSECVKRFMDLALRCVQDKMAARATMLEVVRELENITAVLPPDSDSLYSHYATTTDTPTGAGTRGRTSNFNRPASPIRLPLYSANMITDSGSDLVSGVIPTIGPR